VAEVANRMGIFCYSFLDYDRAVEQFEESLAAAERAGDGFKICRELHNIADALVVSVRVNGSPGSSAPGHHGPGDCERLGRASRALQRLLAEVTPDMHLTLDAHRIEAELLLEAGHPAEALRVIEAAAQGTDATEDPLLAAFFLAESRCLCAVGRNAEAVEAADSAVQLARAGGDDQELVLNLKQRLAAKQASGDVEGALADSVEVGDQIWAIHQREKAQLVEQVWVRTALERQRAQLEESTAAAVRSAEEDALTRIGNRRLLERFLARSDDAPPTLSLVMADIDHFKDINDTFGHELGDDVLRTLGELFSAETRQGQVVARYGGEEFVFALPGADTAAAAGFAERARLMVASHAWGKLEASLAITISLGVASGRSESWRSVLVAADAALYQAKRLGRNRVEVASAALEQAAG
jgi:diguanylate cyclase (GGDEF)-like protein